MTESLADTGHTRIFVVDLELNPGYRPPDESLGGPTALDLSEDGVFTALEHLLEWAPWFTVRNVREVYGGADQLRAMAAAPLMLAALEAVRDDLRRLGLWRHDDEHRRHGLSSACGLIEAAIRTAGGTTTVP